MKSTIYDAIVVGAGVAGSSAAIRLARSGQKVLLLEREKQPHHKVCGEFLSFECEQLLKEVDIDLEKLGAAKISQLRLQSQKHFVKMPLPFYAKGISRKKLDASLQEKALEEGVEFLSGSSVKNVQKVSELSSKEYLVETDDEKYSGKMVFWATGKHDNKNIQQRTSRDKDWVGFKRHFKLPLKALGQIREQIELHLFEGGYLGLSMVEAETVNCCFILEKERVKSISSQWEKLLEQISYRNPRLKEVFSQAEWLWEKPVAISPIPYTFIKKEERSFFFLGDQMAVVPSLTGDGMAMSLLSAKEAVESYLSNQNTEDALSIYEKKMRKNFQKPVYIAGLLQALSKVEWAKTAFLQITHYFPQILNQLIIRTRCLKFTKGENHVH